MVWWLSCRLRQELPFEMWPTFTQMWIIRDTGIRSIFWIYFRKKLYSWHPDASIDTHINMNMSIICHLSLLKSVILCHLSSVSDDRWRTWSYWHGCLKKRLDVRNKVFFINIYSKMLLEGEKRKSRFRWNSPLKPFVNEKVQICEGRSPKMK